MVEGSLILRAKVARKPRLRILAYAGGWMQVDGWGAMAIQLGGQTIPDQLNILADHDETLRGVAATGRPEIREGQLVVEATLVDTPAAKLVRELLSSGVELQASIGMRPGETERLRAGDVVELNGKQQTVPEGGAVLVKTGELREVSVLPYAADSDTRVALAARAARGQGMEKPTDAATDLIAAERKRVADVSDMAKGFPELQAKAVSEGWDVNKAELETLRARAQKAELETLRASRPTAPKGRGTGASNPDVSNRDQLCGALMIQAGRSSVGEKMLGAPAMQSAEDLRVHNLNDLCAASLRLAGQDVPSGRSAMIRAAFSSVDMPYALGDYASKVSLAAYRESPASWRSFAKIINSRDFKTARLIRAVFGGNFQPVAPSGELQHGFVEEEIFALTIGTEGQMLGITRHDVINDDLGLFTGTAEALGKGGIRAVADEVYTVLLENLEPDGATSFFTTGRGNYSTGATTALDIDALATEVALMVSRVDSQSRNLDLRPRTLLVPPELELTAKQILTSTELARYVAAGTDNQPVGNPMFKSLELGVEPRLSNSAFSGYSALAWYLFSAISDGAVAVGFLDGRDGPTVEQVDGPSDTLGVWFRGYIDFGVSLADYRAAQKAKGEA